MIHENIKEIIDNNIDNNIFENVIVMATFNRIDMIKKTFESLFSTNLSKTFIIVIDDNSDEKTQKFIKEYNIPIPNIKMFKKQNTNMHKSFLIAFDYAMTISNLKYYIILDSDTIHLKNWLEILRNTFEEINDKNSILTGFNTKNHPIIKTFKNYHIKRTFGGINMFFTNDFYKNHFRCVIDKAKNCWDWAVLDYCKKNNFKLYCTKPSVIQHIGTTGLNSKITKYDKADDFVST